MFTKSKFFHKLAFILRFRITNIIMGNLRRHYYQVMGMEVGFSTVIPKIFVTWPNKVSIGKYCTLEHNIYFKFDGLWSSGHSIIIGDNVFIGSNCEFNIRKEISIGENCLVASGCRFIDHDHGVAMDVPMRMQSGPEKSIKIGSDVWLGFNVIVLKGVEIGNGAIVAAGSVVVKSILPNEVWAGVPARKIRDRS